MRLLASVVLLAFSPAAFAADKDEDKAKEAAVSLLKAIKAKDLDAVMKLSTAPFVYKDNDKPAVLKDTAALKAWIKERLDELKDADKVPTEVEKVVPFADLKEKIKDETDRKMIEDVVGKDGFAVIVSVDGKMVVIFVRIKDKTAKVVGIVH